MSPRDRAAVDARLAQHLAAALVAAYRADQQKAVVTAGTVTRPPATEKAITNTSNGEKRTAA